jgi:hypothetical protein
MRFYAWDPAKAASNFRKHGVRFEAAVEAFNDPCAVTILDRIEDGEHRWKTLGVASGVIVLLVAHTEEDDGDDEIIRIISARVAGRRERQQYEAARSSRSRR